MLICQAVDAMAKARSHHAFLLGAETGESVSFAEMQERCEGIARMLRRAGLVQGDKVGLLLGRHNQARCIQRVFGFILRSKRVD